MGLSDRALRCSVDASRPRAKAEASLFRAEGTSQHRDSKHPSVSLMTVGGTAASAGASFQLLTPANWNFRQVEPAFQGSSVTRHDGCFLLARAAAAAAAGGFAAVGTLSGGASSVAAASSASSHHHQNSSPNFN